MVEIIESNKYPPALKCPPMDQSSFGRNGEKVTQSDTEKTQRYTEKGKRQDEFQTPLAESPNPYSDSEARFSLISLRSSASSVYKLFPQSRNRPQNGAGAFSPASSGGNSTSSLIWSSKWLMQRLEVGTLIRLFNR